MNALPEKLLKLRKHYRLSQEYLSEILNIEVEDYLAIENGRRILNYEELLKLSDFYRINPRQLFVNKEEVTLYEADDTSTDQINIDYFLKQNRWYRRFFRWISNSKKIQITSLIILAVAIALALLALVQLSKPLVFDITEDEKLSVSNNSVAYISEDGNLEVNGFFDEVSDADIIKVETGDTFIVALKNDGTVLLYGTSEENRKEVSKWRNIEDIEAAGDHIIGIDKFGKFHTVGGNGLGELDLNEMKKTTHIRTFKNCTIGINEEGYLVYAGEAVGKSQFKRYRDPIDYAANLNMTVVVKSDGTVDYSALNDQYASVMGWKDIVNVACGDDFIAGLKKDGTVVIASSNKEMNEEIAEWENIQAIDAGSDYLIGYDGENIVGAGNNEYGQFVKEDKVIKRADTISAQDIHIELEEDVLTVSFKGVENAYAYRVTLDNNENQSVEVLENEKVKFSCETLKEGMFYSISITSLGRDGFTDSLPFEYSFEYTKPEQEKDSETDLADEPSEPSVELEWMIGKNRKEYMDYLLEKGVEESNIIAIEDEVECESNEETIIRIEGYSDGETIPVSKLKERSISYRYCRLTKDGEQESMDY